jgi:hypothetical protein
MRNKKNLILIKFISIFCMIFLNVINSCINLNKPYNILINQFKFFKNKNNKEIIKPLLNFFH